MHQVEQKEDVLEEDPTNEETEDYVESLDEKASVNHLVHSKKKDYLEL